MIQDGPTFEEAGPAELAATLRLIYRARARREAIRRAALWRARGDDTRADLLLMTWHYLIGEIVLDPREAAYFLAASTSPAAAQNFADYRLRRSEDRRGRTYWRAVRGVVEEI